MENKNLLLTLVVIAAFVLTSATLMLPDEPKSKKGEVTWLTFENGLAAAKKDKKLMVVDFYTDWCGWCKKMDKDTYGDSSVIEFARKKLVLVKVNAESNEKTRFREQDYTYRQLAQAFGVSGYPATAFIDSTGEVLTLVEGYLTAGKFLPILEFLEGGHHKTTKFEDYLAKRNKS